MPDQHIYTYHCLCTELILATFTPLENFPKRKGDEARICRITRSNLPAPEALLLPVSTLTDDTPVILKLEDGFEKRYHVSCSRCELKIGYKLDKSQFGDAEGGVQAGVLYLFPGGVMSTEEMEEGKDMETEADFAADVAG